MSIEILDGSLSSEKKVLGVFVLLLSVSSVLETVREEGGCKIKLEQWDLKQVFPPTEELGALSRENSSSGQLKEQLVR